jgi:hypothetical protein
MAITLTGRTVNFGGDHHVFFIFTCLAVRGGLPIGSGDAAATLARRTSGFPVSDSVTPRN